MIQDGSDSVLALSMGLHYAHTMRRMMRSADNKEQYPKIFDHVNVEVGEDGIAFARKRLNVGQEIIVDYTWNVAASFMRHLKIKREIVMASNKRRRLKNQLKYPTYRSPSSLRSGSS